MLGDTHFFFGRSLPFLILSIILKITKIKQLVQDSVAAAARDIAREAAHAATGVLQSQAPSSSQVIPSAQAMSQDTPGGAAILGPQE